MVLVNKYVKDMFGTFLKTSLQETKEIKNERPKQNKGNSRDTFETNIAFLSDMDIRKDSTKMQERRDWGTGSQVSSSSHGDDSGVGASNSNLPELHTTRPQNMKQRQQQNRIDVQPPLVARTQDPIKLPLASTKSAELLWGDSLQKEGQPSSDNQTDMEKGKSMKENKGRRFVRNKQDGRKTMFRRNSVNTEYFSALDRDRYVDMKLFRKGNTTNIFTATDVVYDSKVAVKYHESRLNNSIMMGHFGPKVDSQKNKSKVICEAVAMKLKHEATILHILRDCQQICTFHTYISAANFTMVVQEFLPGGDLIDIIRPNEGLELRKALTIIRDIMKGLLYMHSKGFVHRDMKCENICLDARGNIKIIDFGESVHVTENIDKYFVGTVPYISPELIMYYKTYEKDSSRRKSPCQGTGDKTQQQMNSADRNGRETGPNPKSIFKQSCDDQRGMLDLFAIDMWACGVLFYCIIVGRFPWTQATLKNSAYHAYRNKVESHLEYARWLQLPTKVRSLIIGLCNPDPNARLSIFEASAMIRSERE